MIKISNYFANFFFGRSLQLPSIILIINILFSMMILCTNAHAQLLNSFGFEENFDGATNRLGGSLTYSDGISGYSAVFDGSDAYDIPKNFQGDFTILFWMKTTQAGVGNTSEWYLGAGLVDNDAAGDQNDMGIALTQDKVSVGVGAFTGYTNISSTSSVNTGNWVHVAVTRVQATGLFRLYINGTLEAEATGYTGLLDSNNVLTVGLVVTHPDQTAYVGELDELEIYDEVISEADISADYNSADYGNDAPAITSTAGTTATEDILYTYTASVSDPDDSNNGTDLTWSLSNAPSGMSVSNTGVVTWTPAEGVTTSGTVTLQVADGGENGAAAATENFTITVTTVNDAPSITSTAGTTATEDTLYTYTASVSDSDDSNNGTDLTWSLSNAPSGMSVSSTGVVTWTPSEGVTTSGTVTLQVADGGENSVVAAMEDFTITVTSVNDAPSITSTAGTTATADTLYTYTASVSDPDDLNNGTDLTWSLSNAPSGMVVSSTGVVTWTPAEGVTTSGTVTLQVADGGENSAAVATETFTISVGGTLVSYFAFENNFNNDEDGSDSGVRRAYGEADAELNYNNGITGNAAHFDGDDVFDIAKDFQDDFTISFWMRTIQDGGGTIGEWYTGVGLVDGEASGHQNDMGIALTQDRISLGVGSTSGDTMLKSETSVNTGDWYHVAVTRSKSTGLISLYINGMLEDEEFGSTSSLDATSDLTVGQVRIFNEGDGSTYVGQLDELKIYSSVRSETQVQDEFDARTGDFLVSMVSDYRFDTVNSTPILTDHKKDDLEFDNPDAYLSNAINVYENDPESVSGVSDTAINFSGDDAYDIPKNIQDDFTVSFWMKTTQDGGGTVGEWYTGVGLVDGEVGGYQKDMGIALTQDKISVGVGSSTDFTAISSSSSVNTGEWVHVAMTRSKETGLVRLYVDSELEAEENGVTNTLDATTTLRLGQILALTESDGRLYEGVMDELRIYSWDISETAIKDYFLSYAVNMDPNLIAHYQFEGNFNNRQKEVYLAANPSVTYIDETRKPYGTSTDLTYIEGMIGKSGSFDGDDVYLIPKNFQDDFSISFWMKTTQDGGGTPGEWYTGVGLVDGEAPSYQNDMGISLTQDKISVGVGSTTDTGTLISTSSVNTGNWVHVAVTRSKSSGAINLYINGTLEDQETGPTNSLDATDQLTVGQVMTFSESDGSIYTGELDDLRIYDKVIAPDEISDNVDQSLPESPLSNLIIEYEETTLNVDIGDTLKSIISTFEPIAISYSSGSYVATSDKLKVTGNLKLNNFDCPTIPITFNQSLACIISVIDNVLPDEHSLKDKVSEGLPVEIEYSKNGTLRSLEVSLNPLIDTWLMTPAIFGLESQFAFKSLGVSMAMNFNPSSTGLGSIELETVGEAFVRPTGRDPFLAATPSIGMDVSTSGPPNYTFGMALSGACSGTPNENTEKSSCAAEWNPLGIGLVSASGGLMKLTFPSGSPIPNGIKAYVANGKFRATGEPIHAAISTSLEVPSSGADLEAGIFVHADEISQASMMLMLPSGVAVFDTFMDQVENFFPKLTNVRVLAATVANVFDEDDFEEFNKYIGKTVEYSDLDLSSIKGSYLKADYDDGLFASGSIQGTAEDFEMNFGPSSFDAPVEDFFANMFGPGFAGDFAVQVVSNVKDPVTIVANKIPGGKDLLCNIVGGTLCSGGKVATTFDGSLNLHSYTGSIGANVAVDLFGLSTSFGVDTGEAASVDILAERVAEQMCDLLPVIGSLCSSVLSIVIDLATPVVEFGIEAASTLGSFAVDAVGSVLSVGSSVLSAGADIAVGGFCTVSFGVFGGCDEDPPAPPAHLTSWAVYFDTPGLSVHQYANSVYNDGYGSPFFNWVDYLNKYPVVKKYLLNELNITETEKNIELINAAYVYWQNLDGEHNMYDLGMGSSSFSALYYLAAYPEVQSYRGSIPYQKALNHYKDGGFKRKYHPVPQPGSDYVKKLASSHDEGAYRYADFHFLCRANNDEGKKLAGFWSVEQKKKIHYGIYSLFSRGVVKTNTCEIADYRDGGYSNPQLLFETLLPENEDYIDKSADVPTGKKLVSLDSIDGKIAYVCIADNEYGYAYKGGNCMIAPGYSVDEDSVMKSRYKEVSDYEFLVVSDYKWVIPTSRNASKYAFRASDPELFGCNVYVNGELFGTMAEGQSSLDIDASDGDTVTVSDCKHYDEAQGIYVPWSGSVSSFIDEDALVATSDSEIPTLEANPITTIISAELESSGGATLEERSNALRKAVSMFVGEDIDVDLSDEQTRADMLSAINKPTLELYTEPITISNSDGEKLASVSEPNPDAVAFSAAFASVLEYATIVQEAKGGDSVLSSDTIAELGNAAIEAITSSEDNPDGMSNLAAVVVGLAKSTSETLEINEGISQELTKFLEETVANIKSAIENNLNLADVLISQSQALQSAEFSQLNDTDGDGVADVFDTFPNDPNLIANGDMDGNGLLDVSDALYVLKLAGEATTANDLMYGDVAPFIDGKPSPDGQINAADALIILRRAEGLISW